MIALAAGGASRQHRRAPLARIEIDARHAIGEVPPLLFGHFIEHEHNIIQGGLWAELLRDRKFEQGDADRDGVSDGWVPEERVANRFWELADGHGPHVRYFIDHQTYYGGGAAQAIELDPAPANQASIYQIGLQLVKGRRYSFYVYLKMKSIAGRVWLDIEKLGGPRYSRTEFSAVTEEWHKFTAEFVAPEDTDAARVRIAFQGSGTLWIDSASLMPSDNRRGLRRDVVEALRALHVPVMRYPGGCFADSYHWKDGIGPRDQRPEKWSRIWDNWDPNDFGTDEFLDLAGELGFTPHITANYASGTPQEAAAWAEYANASPATPMGRLRAQNGHPAPYAVKLWAIGNEAAQLCAGPYIGSTTIGDYVARLRQFQAALQSVDPSIRVLAAGTPPGPPGWNRELLRLYPADLLAISIYTGQARDRTLGNRVFDQEAYYRQVVAEPREFEQELDKVLSDTELSARPPRIAITEFNSWWVSERVDPDYRLGNALYFAGVFHSLLRRAPRLLTAEVATTVNVQGVIAVNPAGVKLTPPYFAYLLYANHTGRRVLSVAAKVPMTSFDPRLPALDAVATVSDDGTLIFLAVINRNEYDDLVGEVRIDGWIPRFGSTTRAFELNGTDRLAANPFNSTEQVNVREKSVVAGHAPLSWRFPAHSATVLEIQGQAAN